ncbi:lipocalin family protein [candidate division KSB1 bacterium]|nr:lipocalin family protein [candidate division KSB1 bacterium]RQW09108.1 MAG: hypothetical protein EH222_04575 [candidate division KSB1 bacterium]
MKSVFMTLVLLLFTNYAGGEPMQTVYHVDLQRYVGLWYEIAKIPNSFQKKCASGTTAEYTLLENGKVQVVNRCRESDGREDSAKGVARVVDTKTNAKLQVSFVRFLGKNWFWGDYWIIGLDEDYQWAIVGHPKRKYGWILARTPELAPEDLQTCHNILREQGYNLAEFIATEH